MFLDDPHLERIEPRCLEGFTAYELIVYELLRYAQWTRCACSHQNPGALATKFLRDSECGFTHRPGDQDDLTIPCHFSGRFCGPAGHGALRRQALPDPKRPVGKRPSSATAVTMATLCTEGLCTGSVSSVSGSTTATFADGDFIRPPSFRIVRRRAAAGARRFEGFRRSRRTRRSETETGTHDAGLVLVTHL